jgi:hypothetical protein
MKTDLKIRSFLMVIFILSVLMLINSCDGGGSGSTSNNPGSAGTITGSVSGTTILALDDEGMIISSDNTKRRIPDLDLDDDGIEESYSFRLEDVPVGMRIRIYLVTNEDVYPMFYEDSGYNANIVSSSSATNNENAFSLTSATNIDIGFVDVKEEEAIPEINPLHMENVKPEGADTQRKAISGATIDDFDGTWSGQVGYNMYEEDDCPPEYNCSDYDDHDPCDAEEGYANIEFTLEIKGGKLEGSIHEPNEGWTADVLNPIFDANTAAYKFDLENTASGISIPEEPKPGDLYYDDCRDWNVSFTATLKEDSNGDLNIMDLQGGGTFCGCNGGTTGTFWDEIIRQ